MNCVMMSTAVVLYLYSRSLSLNLGYGKSMGSEHAQMDVNYVVVRLPRNKLRRNDEITA